MVNFKNIARSETVLSELMEGRNQIKTEDVVARFPDGFTVVDFDMAVITDKGEQKVFPIVNIAEDNEVYFNGGTILNKICQEWANAFHGDIDSARRELAKSGGVKMKFIPSKTKSGNNLTRIEII